MVSVGDDEGEIINDVVSARSPCKTRLPASHMPPIESAAILPPPPRLHPDPQQRPRPFLLFLSSSLDRQVALVREWYGAGDDEQAVWGESAFAADRWLHLTPAELAELSRDLVALFDRWSARETPDDPARRPVFVFAHGVPAQP